MHCINNNRAPVFSTQNSQHIILPELLYFAPCDPSLHCTSRPNYQHISIAKMDGADYRKKQQFDQSKGSQKRPRQEEDGADTQNNGLKRQKVVPPRGLHNFASACFANAAVQLLAPAVTPAQIVQLVGDGINDDLVNDEQPLGHLQGKKLSRTLEKVWQRIEDSPPPRLSPYLGKVLEELSSGQSNPVDPVLFQQVFALGSIKESRQKFRGNTQEDASEYLQDLISAVHGEHSFFGEAFQYKIAEAIVCNAPGCSYRNEHPAVSGTLLEAKIPAMPLSTTSRKQSSRQKSSVAAPTTLGALIEHQLGSEVLEGSTCESCKAKNTLARQTRMTEYPDHLIVSINRATFEHLTRGGGRTPRGTAPSTAKDTTKVELSLGDIRVGERGVYRMIAMVKHAGSRTSNGHYTACRKVDEGKWAYLDDEKVKWAAETTLQDGATGFSSILLLQRQPESTSTPLLKRAPEDVTLRRA